MGCFRDDIGVRLLLAISGLFIFSVAATSVALIVSDRAETIHEAEQRNVVLTQVLEEQARHSLTDVKSALRDLSGALMTSGRPAMTPEIAAQMSRLQADAPQVNSFMLVGADGRVAFSTAPVSVVGVNYVDREYLPLRRPKWKWGIFGMSRSPTYS